ncbi:BTB/POZ and MATH domain-containing protein 2 [Rhynchospora pubera]|uniref:BTB/POZ and MATH domain-containing protein 2 n=1 Tax=Rhynchospora pubera TaxID=906938 RepID=A0AAV8D3N4_9POAL|nr:BTB/POZ and MATH domain-containing protein 2 [Rhynchospora pubera]
MEISESVEYIRECTSHHFKFNNTQLKAEKFVSSPLFHAVGHDWVIDYYPRGSCRNSINTSSFIIRLQGEYKEVNPTFRCSLMRKDGTEISLSRILKREGEVFQIAVERSPFQGQIIAYFGLRFSLFDKIPNYDSFELICSIYNTENFSREVPKSFNLQSQIEKLLESSETSDVTFVVENHSFRCHRSILAARSSVLKAELFGNMVEATQKQIKIDDICPEVFKAMLHFMYTDSFPCCEFETVSADEMAQHLLVVADRYAIEGLKALCEGKLCDSISLESVSSTLALAEQHNSSRLKSSCLEFISEPGIMLSWMSTDEYVDLVRNFPSIMVEIRSKVNTILSSMDVRRQKR